EPAALQGAFDPGRIRRHPPPVPDHDGLSGAPSPRAGLGGHAPFSARANRGSVQHDPFGFWIESRHRSVSGPYVIGCDVGSQGTNTALYSDDGRLVASAYEAYDVLFPRPGWAEQDPRAWINALHSTLRRVLDRVADGDSAVKAISFGSQLDGMVVCDAQGKPLRNAVIWMDRRAEAQAAAMAQRVTREDFYHQVGTNLDSSHAVFKARWVRDEEPDVFASAARLMPPGSFVVQEAAGVSMVDYSNASSLALLDPRTRRWSDAVLDAAGLKAGMLPELAPGTL